MEPMEAENKAEQSKMDKLIGHVIECAETRFDLVAIDIQDKVSEILASMASIALVAMLLGFVVLLVSIGAAMYLSEYFESAFIGFILLAAFYLVVAVIVWVARARLVKLPVINAVLKKINFHEED
jgi:hypothetical protein